MVLKRILATTDLSARSDLALLRAMELGRRFSALARVLHVVDDELPPWVAEKEAVQAEEVIRMRTAVLDFNPEIVIRTGDPFQEILREADEVDCDLIVMGPRRKRLLFDSFIGTAVERVMRGGHRPVLMVNRDAGGPYRRVAAAINTGEASANALLSAARMGFFEGVELKLLHAFDPMAKGMMVYANVEREKIEDYVSGELSDTQNRVASFLRNLDLGGAAFDVIIDEGPVTVTLKRRLEKENPDLLVLGTRGLEGVERILLGSTAEALLRDADCDVLAVPPALE